MTADKFKIVEWKNDFCTIRFKTSQRDGEALDFHFLLPFRKVVTRSQRYIRGEVPDDSHDCTQGCQGYNEVKGMVVLVATAHAEVITVQPLELEYQLEGEAVHYHPDFLLTWGSEIWVVEVKPDNQADKHRDRFRHIARLFSTHGITFFVWKKSAITAKPRYDNARQASRYQKHQVSFFDRERIRLLFARTPELPLRLLSDDDIRNVLKLVLEGTLFVDWWTPLSRNSMVSVWPIGRQEWPNDHAAVLESAPDESR